MAGIIYACGQVIFGFSLVRMFP
uniref:Uncharacterized protein n=1 Tax=Anguilla anguilla TaxID=7936 RepID=A0A0E9XYL0_ANGAN